MNSEFVLERRDEAVLWLTLNQPERRNPLSSEVIETLSGLLEKAYADETVRAIVLASTGPVFSAGHDLSEMNQRPDEDAAAFSKRIESILEKCAAMMMGIVDAPKPVIACVQGTATAAGCQLVSACDLAIAASDAGFCTPGVNVGVFCTTPLVGIGRNLSRKHAMEMALTGDIFSADAAVQFGLINRHVSGNELQKETEALAHKIASRSAQSIRDGKHIFYRQIEMPLSDAFSLANKAMRDAVTKTEDAEEGRRAFLDKNAPQWDGL